MTDRDTSGSRSDPGPAGPSSVPDRPVTGTDDAPEDRPGPGLPDAEGTLDRALSLVRFLRERCPWDRAQTPETLIPHLLEEAHEVVDAIGDGDPSALEGELGDLLLNLAFQVVLGEEAGEFDAGSVVSRLEGKMRSRHPHLFGLGERQGWETLKARERDPGVRVLDGIARGLDPLTRAHRIQERVSGVGFDWSDYRGARDKVLEELEEVSAVLEERRATGAAGGKRATGASTSAPEGGHRTEDPEPPAGELEEELGDLLFAVVNLVRLAGGHATTALGRANRKFRRRFERLEALAEERDVPLPEADLETLDRMWDELKADEEGTP